MKDIIGYDHGEPMYKLSKRDVIGMTITIILGFSAFCYLAYKIFMMIHDWIF